MYKVLDWAGNDKTPYYGLFETPEAAWGAVETFIRAQPEIMDLTDDDKRAEAVSEWLGEYQVLPC